MEYVWLLIIWIVYIAFIGMYAMYSGIVRKKEGDNASTAADVMFFGVASVLALTTTSVVNSEMALKRPI